MLKDPIPWGGVPTLFRLLDTYRVDRLASTRSPLGFQESAAVCPFIPKVKGRGSILLYPDSNNSRTWLHCASVKTCRPSSVWVMFVRICFLTQEVTIASWFS